MLCCLFLLPGDLTISLQSGAPAYAVAYLSFYFAAVVLYLWLQRSDPGFLTTEEHHALLEDGEMRRRSKDRCAASACMPRTALLCTGCLVPADPADLQRLVARH